MNKTQNVQPSGLSSKDTNAGQETSDVNVERFRQYTSRMERFLLSKHIDASELQEFVWDSSFGEKDKRFPGDPLLINKTRHAAMGELLGVVAHKWRQPLNSIALTIHNMVDAWKYGEMNDELMERSESRAMEQINLLTRTIDDFRTFLDPDTTTEQFDPLESVKLVVAQLSGWFSNTSRIDLRVIADPAAVIRAAGCQHAFERVIVNLICNANDSIDERQRATGPVPEGVITVSIKSSVEDIVISVEDNGTGIDESSRAHIFEPYFTTKHNSDGFGMGLYLSRLIVENSMHGNMWFDDIAGGARFNIMLSALPDGRTCE